MLKIVPKGESMQNCQQYDNDEITIDLKKILNIFLLRKKIIAANLIIIMCFFGLLTFILPKKYKTDAKLYINSASSTNLMELNPYLLGEVGAASSGGGISKFLGGGSNLKNEIEIIQSPLVMDEVIKENGLRYKKGRKEGQLLSTADFLEKNVSISDSKDTNIISISYKAKKPELAYNVVNSIIKHYKNVKQLLNVDKTEKDIDFLLNAYNKTEKDLNSQIDVLKSSDAKIYNSVEGMGNVNLVESYYDKNIKQLLNKMADKSIDSKKINLEVERNITKLKMIQSKLDWSKLVQQMAKNTSNIIVLEAPIKKEEFEYSEPKLIINLLLGYILAVFTSIISIIIAEIRDKKLTYSSFDENTVSNEDELNQLIINLSAKDERATLLAPKTANNESVQQLASSQNVSLANVDTMENIITSIKGANSVILAGKIGETPKKTYKLIKQTCKELDKNIISEVIIK